MLLDQVTGTSTYVNDTVYDAAGRVDLRGLGSTTLMQQDYQYYAWTTQGGRLSGIDSGRVTYPPASLQDMSYTYDVVGNITGIVDSLNSQTQEFNYDSLNRLTSASATGTEQQGGYSESYTYSAATGNLASKANVSYKYAEVAYGGVLPAHGVRRATKSGGTSKTVTIRAKGTICDGGYPEMKLYVNGVYQEDWIVTSAYADYTKSVILSEADIIEVVFTNDCSGDGEDRNLYVDYIVVDGQTIQAEGGAGVIDKGGGSAAFDDVNVVVGQENIAWNGSLRFAVGRGAFAGGYDANGNMTVRVVDGKGQVLSYDVENRLVEVRDSLNTDGFGYDGDGKRVKADVGNVVTYYVGNYFEWTGSTSTMVKYYYAGVSRVAMRVGASTVYYLLTDHLGGTNVTVTTAGVEYGEVRYRAWGETRYASGTTPTTFRFTGQRQEQSLGLYYYGARWYDPALGRFVQADSIVPTQQGVMGNDRYAYVNNSPLNFTDPLGHMMTQCGPDGQDCNETEYITQDDVAILWDQKINESVSDKQAAELAFLHYLQDPDYFVALYADPAAWVLSEEAANFDVFLQYSLLHTTANDFMAVGFDLEVASNLQAAHAAYGMGDMESTQTYLAAAGVLTIAEVDAVYTKLAGRSNWHHYIPMYLGGSPGGIQYKIPASYHQYITNEFRQLWAYGRGRPSPMELQNIVYQVYLKYPIPFGSEMR